ncbi:mitochondrial amidoxime reducing component 2-like isoform X2 [Cherax quadricarinatus]|uniref:mitochondrial amidoxime reducing component 2-like isoform X2 n=1 Tax=Cherax quadricarinatus TaxID=27406 RepID=UPI00387E5D57
MVTKTAVGVGVSVGVSVGVGAVAVWWVWRQRSAQHLQFMWEEVGEVSELTIYPLKSGRGVSVNSAQATSYGLAHGKLEDRSFLVMTEDDNRAVSGRQMGRLTMVSLTLEDDLVTIGAQGVQSVKFRLKVVLKEHKVFHSKVWKQHVSGVDCGEEVASFLTQFVSEGRTRLRLLYRGDVVKDRPARRLDYYDFPKSLDSDKNSAYVIASESSLAVLNSRLSEPVTMGQFRTNIVVRGAPPSDEDDWAYVKIGCVVFRTVKPCQRCLLTTVDPITGKRHPKQEPLNTLRSFRTISEPAKLAKAWATSPLFGINMAIDVTGPLAVGDKVIVARTSSNPELTVF